MQQILFFQEGELQEWLRERKATMCAEVEGLSPQSLTSSDEVELISTFENKVRLEQPVLLDEELVVYEPEFTDESECKVRVHIPFEGSPEFLRYGYQYEPFWRYADIGNGELIIEYRVPKSSITAFQGECSDDVRKIKNAFRKTAVPLRGYNESLAPAVRAIVARRKQGLQIHSTFVEAIPQAGFKLIRREDQHATVLRSVHRKKLELPKKTAQTAPAPEPILPDAAYEDILRVIESMAVVFERNPTVFREMKEEDLRTILLVGLNATFEGKATGETFNGEGKTDILIRDNGQNLFIAECLMWKGQKYFLSKIEQLFGYSTWRDSKLALLVFNRNEGFSSVVEVMKTTVTNHQQHIKVMTSYSHESGSRHAFKRTDDPERQFTLTCLAFDILK